MISTTLKGAQLNYFITEKGLYAVFWSLKKLEVILFGAFVGIRTDHKALEFLEKCRLTNNRITICLLLMQRSTYEIKMIERSTNTAADFLTRKDDDYILNVNELVIAP